LILILPKYILYRKEAQSLEENLVDLQLFDFQQFSFLAGELLATLDVEVLFAKDGSACKAHLAETVVLETEFVVAELEVVVVVGQSTGVLGSLLTQEDSPGSGVEEEDAEGSLEGAFLLELVGAVGLHTLRESTEDTTPASPQQYDHWKGCAFEVVGEVGVPLVLLEQQMRPQQPLLGELFNGLTQEGRNTVLDGQLRTKFDTLPHSTLEVQLLSLSARCSFQFLLKSSAFILASPQLGLALSQRQGQLLIVGLHLPLL
jgi:hypothetical protein